MAHFCIFGEPPEGVVGYFAHFLPVGAKPGDECPNCIDSGHTGIFNPATGRYRVCMVCADKGVIDALSITYYGTPD